MGTDMHDKQTEYDRKYQDNVKGAGMVRVSVLVPYEKVDELKSIAREMREAIQKKCPICGHPFKVGWTGIDVHWKSPNVGHEDILSYSEARQKYGFGEVSRILKESS